MSVKSTPARGRKAVKPTGVTATPAENEGSPLSAEHKCELSCLQSEFLQLEMLTTWMENKTKEMLQKIGGQAESFQENFTRQLTHITSMEHRLIVVQQLAEQENLCDELVVELKAVQENIQKIAPNMEKFADKIKTQTNKVEFQNTVLPTCTEEKETLMAIMNDLQGQCSAVAETTNPAKVKWSVLCNAATSIEEKTHKSSKNYEKIMKEVSLLKAQCVALQHILVHNED